MKHVMNGGRKRQVLVTRMYGVVLLCGLLTFWCGSCVLAHAPSEMTVTYHGSSHMLEVVITHQVSDTSTHFIKEIQIDKNGVFYNLSLYLTQPDKNVFRHNYTVDAVSGDVFSVTAKCNQGGSRSAEVTITANDTGTGGSETTETPGFEAVLVVGASGVCLILLRRRFSV